MSDETLTPARNTSSSPFIEPQTSFGTYPTPSRLEANRSVDEHPCAVPSGVSDAVDTIIR